MYILGRGFGEFSAQIEYPKLNQKDPLSRDTVHLEGAKPCTLEDEGKGECTNNKTICGTMESCNKFSPMMGGKTPSWTVVRIHFGKQQFASKVTIQLTRFCLQDHEGAFLNHCHISSHSQLGLVMVFIVDDDKPGYNKLPKENNLPLYGYDLGFLLKNSHKQKDEGLVGFLLIVIAILSLILISILAVFVYTKIKARKVVINI